LITNTEFSEQPLCLGAEEYQGRKVEELNRNGDNEEARSLKVFEVLEKACLCRDLAGGALIRTGIDPRATPAICCGPNIVNFKQVFSLKQMIDHIYGRCVSLVQPGRPHLFIKEIQLYVDFMMEELRRESLGLISYPSGYFSEYTENLLKGIDYYAEKAEKIVHLAKEDFLSQLERFKERLQEIQLESDCEVAQIQAPGTF
jgi:hypothetical protein